MYNALLERWQEERTSTNLLPLRDSFLQRLREYIENLLTKMKAEDIPELQRHLHETELTNLRFMLNDLIKARINKILLQLINSSNLDFDRLTRQERRFVDQLSRNMRIAFMLEDDLFAPIDAESTSRSLMIRFIEDHPQISGVDLRTYGPFKADDLAALPAENARALIRRNKAELVSVGVRHSEGSQDH